MADGYPCRPTAACMSRTSWHPSLAPKLRRTDNWLADESALLAGVAWRMSSRSDARPLWAAQARLQRSRS